MKLSIKAEFDQYDYLVLCWKIHYNELFYRTLVKHILSDSIQLVLVYKTENDQHHIEEILRKYNINLEQIIFLQYDYDSVWVRDYGPIPIRIEQQGQAYLNYQYPMAGRGKDNQFASFFTKEFGLPLRSSKVSFFGGNLTTNGTDILICTKNILRFNSFSETEIKTILKEELNLKKCLFLERLTQEKTGHIDMIVKFASPTDLLITRLSPAHPDYDLMEQNIRYLTQTLGDLVNFHFLPIAPDDGDYAEIGSYFYSYINSIILNESIVIPLFGENSDDEAWKLFENVFPKHQIKGVYCKDLIGLRGALHCLTWNV